ncbi:hypothetical protein K4L44_11015 [Halosquirtibacter laminarini]|uniref:Uncharacterized protein n=1 Tax=Halosquirtibacter laminarini TaxID=3374600 RepID=A0AC61NQU8_9BACT|nr:hypothetical protein K4L44_11015 [Prolixibacteraceae bacterium]
MILTTISRNWFKIAPIVIASAFFSGCSKDNYKFDNIEIEDIKTQVSAPVANGKFQLWDFFEGNSNENIKKSESGDIIFTYTENEVIKYDLSELYTFPTSIPAGDINFDIPAIPYVPGLTITVPPIEVTEKTPVVTTSTDNSSLQVYEANITTGKLKVHLTNPHPSLNADIEMTLIGSTQKTTSGEEELVFNLEATPGVNNVEFDLNDVTLNFDHEDNADVLPVKIKIQFKGDVNQATDASKMTLSLHIDDLVFYSIEANLGKQEINIENQVVDVDIDALNELGDGLKFTNPSIEITTKTNISAYSILNANIVGYNTERDPVDLNPAPYHIVTPSKEEGNILKEGKYIINKDNSNIVDFIGLPPNEKITFDGKVSINKDLDGNSVEVTRDNPNIIYPDSQFKADFKMESPLQFEAHNLNYSDTIDLNENIEELANVKLIFKYEHKLPLNISAIAQPYNKSNNTKVGDEITFNLIPSAEVDEEGNPIEMKEGYSYVSLTKKDIENINNTDAIILKLTINTPDGKKANLKADLPFNFELATEIGVEVKN